MAGGCLATLTRGHLGRGSDRAGRRSTRLLAAGLVSAYVLLGDYLTRWACRRLNVSASLTSDALYCNNSSYMRYRGPCAPPGGHRRHSLMHDSSV
ncbi:hypothetical protein FA95DRAFT_1562881 [Auriscalpium vulgare]|uniref:Uncharacterized protein n=1 Tax=Auriscalpium vulgare TaxID=40419 RepID=A0ACB8RK25_9AGAM|nr:hypothetical protein FA95DRAFT_1562881 [Auriscalpium vulgare]